MSNSGAAGGVVGYLQKASFTAKDVHVYGEDSFVYAYSDAGGFSGYIGNNNNTILDIDSCSASVYVASENIHAGGFAAEINAIGDIKNCYVGGHTAFNDNDKAVYLNTQALTKDGDDVKFSTKGGYNVYGGDNSGNWTGGFIGKNIGALTIYKCFTTASVSAQKWKKLSGFCGGNWDNSVKGTIKNCYTAGKVFPSADTGIICVFAGDKCNNNTTSETNYYLSSVYDDTSDTYYHTMENNERNDDRGQATPINHESLAGLQGNNKPSLTIRFDDLVDTNESVLNYPYPFYASDYTDKTFYGDWSTNGEIQNNIITLNIIYDENEPPAEIYYFRGRYYATLEEANAAKDAALAAGGN